MKKIILFFLVLLMLVSCSQMENELSIPQNETRRDGKISQEQARENLIKVRGNFYPETRGKEPVISSCVSYRKSMTPTTRSGEEPIIYVFNYEDNQGFAIMSATPALPEVLAISEKGNLDLQNLPDNGVKAFVSRIGEFVEDPDTMAVGDGIPYTVNFPWQTTIKTEPLCKVKWDQGSPYNKYTPMVSGHKSYVGCGGVAVAQAMSIYHKPASFQGYNFNWDAMTQSHPSDDAMDQIARFMEVIGRPGIGDFYYLENGTGADLPQLVNVLHQCGYEEATDTLVKLPTEKNPRQIFYYEADVRNELELLRPVIVLGSTENNDIGGNRHIWLLHGFMEMQRKVQQRVNTINGYDILSERTETEEYVLCNWGWSGMYDGYYLNGIFDMTGDEYILEEPNPNAGSGPFDFPTS